MKKRIFLIHRWLGVTLGAIIFLLGMSGAAVTFRPELMPKFYPSLFTVIPGEHLLSLETILLDAARYLGPDKTMTNLYPGDGPEEAYIIQFNDPARSLPSILTVDPYSGAVIGEMNLVSNIFAMMLFMHGNLFMGKVGSYFVGIMGIVVIFFIISGIYVWLPKSFSLLKLKMTFKFKKRFVQKIHHLLGLLFAAPLLISALTGFFTVFDVPYYVSQFLKKSPPRVEELAHKFSVSFEDQLNSLSLITPAIRQNLISVHLSNTKNGFMKVSYGLRDNHFLYGYERIILDPRSKKIVQTFNSDKDPSSWNIKRMIIFPIHTGEYFGVFGRIISFLSGIALMISFCTGVTLFYRRRTRNKQRDLFSRNQPASVITKGICKESEI